MSHATTCSTLVRNGPCTCPAPSLEVMSPGTVWLHCNLCDESAWPAVDTTVTIAQLILAEQKHLEERHAPDYSGVRDAVGEDGE